LVAALKEPGAFPEYRTITSEQADRAATLLRQQQHLLGLACAELDRLGAFSAAPAPAPAVAPVAEDLQHLIRFMCRTWVAIDEWASMFSEAMDTYPMIQGTRNQMNLREIAAQSYDIRRVAFGVQLMLPHNAIPLPQAGEVEVGAEVRRAAPAPEPTRQDEALIALDRIESGDVSYGADDFDLVRCALANRAAPAAALSQPAWVADWDDGFMAGVCVALATVKAHGAGAIWRDIVCSVGVDNALNYAANVSPEDWDLAGFSEYAQLELGKDKPLPLPQAGEVEA
jgi:hypothetical protein